MLKGGERIHDVYEQLDDGFLKAWSKYGQPVQDDAGELANQLSGQMLQELGQVFNTLAESLKNAALDILAQSWDWFGLFTSGVPQGFSDNAFFWSDMFHYRKTYEFAQRLWTNAVDPELHKNNPADIEKHKAFALGWMSHCATDVTGHPFVNSKCGGPYRTHWQRHHLIENHMDCYVYDGQHGGVEPYGEYDTSALHFRIAFRVGQMDPYLGMKDAPAYDYFTGFPSYKTGQNQTDRGWRDALFDLDSGDFPQALAELLIQSMHDVWDGGHSAPGRGGPKVLFDVNPNSRDGDTGMPSVGAIQKTFWVLYDYVKFTCSSGFNPPRPIPPPIIGDKRPPCNRPNAGGLS